MTYWLDLFTGRTWEQFREAGATVSGFRETMQKYRRKPIAGDILLCYLTGVMRWVGALEVVARSNDRTKIWDADAFPYRFQVKPLVVLDPEHGVPLESLEGKLDFYRSGADRGGFRGFLRMSPNAFKRKEDGDLILAMMRQAQANPVERPVDPRKLARKPTYLTVDLPKGKNREPVQTVISVPEADTEAEVVAAPVEAPEARTRHTEIQYRLLELGVALGLDVWVARNDRSKTYNGTLLGSLPRMLDELPTQFNEATTRTIELIDVLWLKGNSIIAAFEVEATTSVYSGLLRMSDLLSLQPNLDIQLFLVAPDDRRAKVAQEIRRPTFSYREKPLPKICGFLPFDKLMQTIEGIERLGLASSLKPEFLRTSAEYFDSTAAGES
jgi:hypothetical protein